MVLCEELFRCRLVQTAQMVPPKLKVNFKTPQSFSAGLTDMQVWVQMQNPKLCRITLQIYNFSFPSGYFCFISLYIYQVCNRLILAENISMDMLHWSNIAKNKIKK